MCSWRTLACVLIASGVSAHAAHAYPAKPPPSTGLVVWHTQDRFQAQFLRGLLTEFMRTHPGVKVELEDIIDLPAVLLKGAALGRLPDVVFAPADTAAMHIPLGLSDVSRRARNPDVGSEHYDSLTIDGKAYGEPVLSGNHLVFYYNKALLPVAPKTWEELVEAVPKRSVNETTSLAFGAWPFTEPYFFLPFLLTLGGLDLSTATLDDAKSQEALGVYSRLARDGVVAPRCGYTCATDDFYAGKFAFAVNGEWAFEDARKALGANFGMAPLPSLQGVPMVSPRGTFALLFPRKGLEGPKATLLRSLTRYLQSTPVQKRYVDEARRFPVNLEIQRLLAKHQDPDFRELATLLNTTAPVTPSPRMLFLWPALRKGVTLHLSADLTLPRTTKLMNETSAAAKLAFERLTQGDPRP